MVSFRVYTIFDQAWDEVVTGCDKDGRFDVLYVSYLEVKHGAPKTFLSNNVFRPVRGLWYLSGYVLSREGAEKLLRLLPCRGPIDLWINHQFKVLDIRATKRPIISQRRDAKSTNSYSILPTLTTIGAITSEGASLFNIRPTEHPVFAFGPEGSGHSSLAMALSMLGYRCCSDLQALPAPELERLLEGRGDRVFDAYVNIGSLDANVRGLRSRYPKAKFILTAAKGIIADDTFLSVENDLNGADIAVLHSEEPNRWQVVCEHLRCAPPTCSFPTLKDLGQRPILDVAIEAEPRLQNAKGLGVISRHGSLSPVSGGKAFAPSRQRMVRRALERSLESTTVWNISTRDAGFYEMTLSRTIWRCFAPQTSSSVLELGLRFPSEGSR